MKNETQPQHTQGEWIQNGVNGIHSKEGKCIAVTYGIGYGVDVRKANAQRIVKAVNMHDELISVLDELTSRVERDCSIGSDPKFMELLNIRTKARLLLKQAEQE